MEKKKNGLYSVITFRYLKEKRIGGEINYNKTNKEVIMYMDNLLILLNLNFSLNQLIS